VTYNNECKRELETRLAKLGVHRAHGMYVGTVHGFCFQQIVVPFARAAGISLSDSIVPASSQKGAKHFENAAGAIFGASRPSDLEKSVKAYRLEKTLAAAGAPVAKNAAVSHFAAALQKQIADTAELYVSSLRVEGLIDFDDMTLLALELLSQHDWVRQATWAKFPILLIDEYQDLGPVLHQIVRILIEQTKIRLLAVGDPDQSMYGFAGAKPELLMSLSTLAGVEVVRLPFNYRFGSTIARASEAALGELRDYVCKSEYAGTVDLHECKGGIGDQADFICKTIIPGALAREKAGGHTRVLGDIAVLYSDKNVGNVIAAAASANGYSFQRIDAGAPYVKSQLMRWVEDCAAWCSGGWIQVTPKLGDLLNSWRWYADKHIERDAARERDLRLVEFLKQNRFTSHEAESVSLAEWFGALWSQCLSVAFEASHLSEEKSEMEKMLGLSARGGSLEGMSLFNFAGQRGAPESLNLLTLHSAKGLEFDVIVIMGADEGQMPSARDNTDAAIRESRRKFYVGVTRAKREVHITYSGWYKDNWKRRENGPSRFVNEIRTRLLAHAAEA